MKAKILILTVFLIWTCHQQSNPSPAISILKTTLENSKVVNFLHPEVDGRDTLYMIENDHFKLETEISIRNIETFTVVKKETVKGKNVLHLKKLEVQNNKASLNFYYEIENIDVTARLIKKEDQWIIEKIEIIEF